MAVEIYTKSTCMFCEKAKAWLKEHNIPYTEIDAGSVQSFKDMQARVPDAKTVPQIIIDGHIIGGWDVLEAHQTAILEKLRETYPA
jgi:glutaredoxin